MIALFDGTQTFSEKYINLHKSEYLLFAITKWYFILLVFASFGLLNIILQRFIHVYFPVKQFFRHFLPLVLDAIGGQGSGWVVGRMSKITREESSSRKIL